MQSGDKFNQHGIVVIILGRVIHAKPVIGFHAWRRNVSGGRDRRQRSPRLASPRGLEPRISNSTNDILGLHSSLLKRALTYNVRYW
jgi:hypothetical protein